MVATKPPEDWPGLEAERDGVGYDAEKIANIAKALREIMEPLNGGGYVTKAGSIQDLSAYASLQTVRDQLQSVDRWPGGGQFATTLKTSYETLVEVYGDILENFSTAISLVEAGAGDYLTTDGANQGI